MCSCPFISELKQFCPGLCSPTKNGQIDPDSLPVHLSNAESNLSEPELAVWPWRFVKSGKGTEAVGTGCPS